MSLSSIQQVLQLSLVISQAMRREYYQKMNLDQIIEYLRDGVKGSTLKPATVNAPTISHMVASLEQYRDKYVKYKSAALKKQQPQKQQTQANSKDQINFYHNILAKISQHAQFKQLPNQCGVLQAVVTFYNRTRQQVGQCYRNFGQSNRKNVDFWEKVEKCIWVANANFANQPDTVVKQDRSRVQMNTKIADLQQQLETQHKVKIDEYKKLCRIYESLVKMICDRSPNWDVQGLTVADKCESLTQQINSLIQTKTARFRQLFGGSAPAHNTNLNVLFNIISEFEKNIHEQEEKNNKKGLSSNAQNKSEKQSFGLMGLLFGSQGQKVGEGKKNIQMQAVDKTKKQKQQHIETHSKNILEKQIQTLQKQNSQLKKDIKYYLQRISSLQQHYDQLKQTNQKYASSADYWMRLYNDLNQKYKQVKHKMEAISQEKLQNIFELLEIQDKQLDVLFTKLKQSDDNNPIKEYFDENEERDKKRQLLKLILKQRLECGQFSPLKEPIPTAIPSKQVQYPKKSNLSISVQVSLKIQSVIKFQIGTIKNSVFLKFDSEVISEVIKTEEKSSRMGIVSQPQDHAERSSSSKKNEKQIKQLRDKVERYESSITTLKRQLEKQKSKTQTGNVQNQNTSEKEELTRFQQLKQTQAKLADEIEHSSELTKSNEALRKQNQELKQSFQKLNLQMKDLKKIKEDDKEFETKSSEYQSSVIQQQGIKQNSQKFIEYQIEKSQINQEHINRSISNEHKEQQTEVISKRVDQKISSVQNQAKTKNQIQDTESKLTKLKQQKELLKASLGGIKTDIEKQQEKLSQLKGKVNQKTKKLQQLEKDIEERKKEADRLQAESSKAAAKIRKYSEDVNSKSESSSSKQQVQKGKDEIKLIQETIKKLLDNKAKVEKDNNLAIKVCSDLGKKEKTLKENIASMQESLKVLVEKEQQVNKIIQNIDTFKQQKSQFEEKLLLLQNRISELEQTKEEKCREVEQCNMKLKSFDSMKTEYSHQKTKCQKLKESLKEHQNQLQNIKQQIEKQKDIKKKEAQNSKIVSQKIESKRKELDQLLNQIKNYEQKLYKIELSLQKKKNQNLKYGGFPNRHFIGQVVQMETDRQYILDQVEKIHKGKQIVKTKLLYSFPLMRDINPHLIIDGVPNIIFVVKCPVLSKFDSNYIFAMYTANPLIKNAPTNNGLGFISAVTENQTFYLKKSSSSNSNPRITEYNQFYIIFGNAQIRIRINSFSLETNIGNMFKSFDTGTLKDSTIFTGDINKETQILSYEIYQVIFKGEQEKEKIFEKA